MSEAKPQPYTVRPATVTPPTVHHVSNPGAKPCRFLLIQGVGRYDFVKANP